MPIGKEISYSQTNTVENQRTDIVVHASSHIKLKTPTMDIFTFFLEMLLQLLQLFRYLAFQICNGTERCHAFLFIL